METMPRPETSRSSTTPGSANSAVRSTDRSDTTTTSRDGWCDRSSARVSGRASSSLYAGMTTSVRMATGECRSGTAPARASTAVAPLRWVSPPLERPWPVRFLPRGVQRAYIVRASWRGVPCPPHRSPPWASLSPGSGAAARPLGVPAPLARHLRPPHGPRDGLEPGDAARRGPRRAGARHQGGGGRRRRAHRRAVPAGGRRCPRRRGALVSLDALDPTCFAFQPGISAGCRPSYEGPDEGRGDGDERRGSARRCTTPSSAGRCGWFPSLDGLYLARLISGVVAAALVATVVQLAAAARSAVPRGGGGRCPGRRWPPRWTGVDQPQRPSS